MKQTTCILVIVLLCGNTGYAVDDYSLQAGHFDVTGGVLTVNPSCDLPLPDGCLGQIILDHDGQGAVPPDVDGSPGMGDALLPSGGISTKSGNGAVFRTNGGQLFGMMGWFFSERFNSSSPPPVQKIFLRVWNSGNPAEATGYWESPLCAVLAGFQQINFRKDEWVFYELDRPTMDVSGDSEAFSAEGSASAADKSLLEAWPNPFNSTARIRLNLEQPADVSLKIFDVQGRLVKELAEGPQPAGSRELTFSADGLPSGLYFISLRVDHDRAVVKRLLLVR